MVLRLWCVLGLVLAGAACAGELSDPESFRQAREGAGEGDTDGTADSGTTDTNGGGGDDTTMPSDDTDVINMDTGDTTVEADTAPPVCEPIGVTALDLIETSCATEFCHSAQTMSAQLNMEPDGIEDRLYNVPAVACSDQLLIDPDNPSGSYILNKLLAVPECASQMPLASPPLNADEVQCLTDWVEALVAERQGE
ncbi:MAG: hypothetical protein AAFX99_02055 [Myxococcota bacterium]